MLSQDAVARLEAIDAGDARVLSVYLDLDPAGRMRHAYRVAFRDLAKEERERLHEFVRPRFDDEVARTREWLEGHEPPGKGLALFSCAPQNLWETDSLAVRVRNHLTFEPRADVAPLLEIVDEYERYVVAVVDKEKARLYTVFAGEIEEHEEFKDWVFGKTDQGGWSQANYQRHHETHMHWHLKHVARRLAELHRRRRFDRLILAGPEEPVNELRRLLPRALAHRVAAVVPGAMFANDQAILEATLAIERQVEQGVEDQLVKQLLDLVGPVGQATLGVAPTLAALWSELVLTLVVAHDVHSEGSECTNCGRLDPGRVKTCPTCDHAMRPVHDLFHRAMGRAVEQAASVDVVHGAAARLLIERGGGMGALLRHHSPVPNAVAEAEAARKSA